LKKWQYFYILITSLFVASAASMMSVASGTVSGKVEGADVSISRVRSRMRVAAEIGVKRDKYG
jgi:hypothetical protein